MLKIIKQKELPEIKCFLMLYKNFIFANLMTESNSFCLDCSITRAAIANNLKSYQYLLEFFNRFLYCKIIKDYKDLLLWNIQQNNKHKIRC